METRSYSEWDWIYSTVFGRRPTAKATWYINNNWGIAADYEKDDINGFEVDRISLGVEWFITENLAVELAGELTEPDDINFDGGQKLETEDTENGINALYRF